jgi:hypothetical protein
MTNEVLCPKCGSNQITAHKKGFSGKKLLPALSLLAELVCLPVQLAATK